MPERQAFLSTSQGCELRGELVNSLPEMQAEFIRQILLFRHPKDAAEAAGYAMPEQAAWRLLKSPAVLAALHEGVQRELARDAPQNLKVLRDIRDDVAAPARVRADIGVKLLNMAGHITPRTKEDAPQKAISEMTQAELLAYIDRNQAAIERAESELLAKAKDITPDPIVTSSVQTRDDSDAKAVSYLD